MTEATIKAGAVSVHTSESYHSSIANISGRPRVGMVVHFCMDRAKRVPVSGDYSDYLEMARSESVCPVIYRS